MNEDIPMFVLAKRKFDAQFTELYLAGYSATLIAEKMGKKFGKINGKDDYQRKCQAWNRLNRKKLNLPARYVGFQGINHNGDYTVRLLKEQQINQRKLSLLFERKAKLQKRMNLLNDKINELQKQPMEC